MHIYNNIDRLLNINPMDKLMAHSNCYPSHYGIWKLSHEFQLETDLEIVNHLKNVCNLDLDDHFQSGVLLFNSSIIENDTFNNLYELINVYAPLIKYNDQTIFNLYFISIKNIWKPLPIRDSYGLLYDYWERGCNYNEYIMLKEPLTDPNRFYISDLWQ
jgi:lipopolysaccharide biosynthesis glycosyltransferase